MGKIENWANVWIEEASKKQKNENKPKNRVKSVFGGPKFAWLRFGSG